MTHPADVASAWHALAEAAHTDQLSEPMRFLATALEGVGLKVTVVHGVLYADDVNVDPDTGIADCAASFRIEQEN